MYANCNVVYAADRLTRV